MVLADAGTLVAAPATGDETRPPTATNAATQRPKDMENCLLFAGRQAPLFVLGSRGRTSW
jgi:hypothetical protein